MTGCHQGIFHIYHILLGIRVPTQKNILTATSFKVWWQDTFGLQGGYAIIH